MLPTATSEDDGRDAWVARQRTRTGSRLDVVPVSTRACEPRAQRCNGALRDRNASWWPVARRARDARASGC